MSDSATPRAAAVPLPADLSPYLDGTRLYGDDFSAEQIEGWYADEAEAYARLREAERLEPRYGYHGWNTLHGFDRLAPGRRFARVVSFGGADGEELLPIVERSDDIVLVDPSETFPRETVGGVPVRYVTPVPSGDLPMEAGSVDLITCFGVLHHIPNVSRVIAELARVLAPGGTLLLREPIVSMGDWRAERPGLTARERGIPRRLLREACTAAGLTVERDATCGFALTPTLLGPFVEDVYNNRVTTRIDAALCRAFAWNARYHARTAREKLRPTSAFLVLTKP